MTKIKKIMLRTKKMIALVLAATAGACCAQAQKVNEYDGGTGVPERVLILTGDSTKMGDEMVAVLYDTKDLHFQDPRAPRFLFLDREGNTALGIGGYVEGVAQYDFCGSIDDNGFTTFQIPVPRDAARRNRFGADATHSTIFLQLVRNTKFGLLSAYVQTNFSGDNGSYGVRVKQAYVKLGYVTAGLARSSFVDGASGLPTIDYEGPSGAISGKNVLLQYAPKLSKHFSMAVSIENPSATYTTFTDPSTDKAQNEAISQRVPDIPAYLQYSWGKGGDSHVRLSGILRNLSYRNLVSGKNHFVTGYGVQLSGLASLNKFVTLYYQGAYGKGIGRYVNDLGGFGYDLIYGDNGTMTAPETLSLVGGAQINLTDNLFVSGGYSLNRVYGQESLGGDAYRRANYVVANAFYTFAGDFQVGVEYLRGIRRDMNGESNTANRIEAMLKFSF